MKTPKEQSCEGCQYKNTSDCPIPSEVQGQLSSTGCFYCPAWEARDNRKEAFEKILKRTIENNKDLLRELEKL